MTVPFIPLDTPVVAIRTTVVTAVACGAPWMSKGKSKREQQQRSTISALYSPSSSLNLNPIGRLGSSGRVRSVRSASKTTLNCPSYLLSIASIFSRIFLFVETSRRSRVNIRMI